MHFWIDKSKFGGNRRYSFRGRHRNRPLGVSVSRVRRRSPKPMVTPVHRFTSLEAVTGHNQHHTNHNNNPTSPPHQQHQHHQSHNDHQQSSNQHNLIMPQSPPILIPHQSHHHRPSHNATFIQISDSNTINSTNSNGHVDDNIRSMFIDHQQQCPRNQVYRNNIKIYGVVPSLVLAIILIAYTKFYFDTQRGGYEMLTIIGMLGLFALVWHTIYRHVIFTAGAIPLVEPPTQIISVAAPIEEPIPVIPPPPYHIAILLPSDPRDLPPPSYDNAVNKK